MVGRDFALEQAGRDEDVLFHAADWFEKREDVPEGLGPSDLENVSSKSVYLRCTVLDSEDVEVEGDKATATVERVLPPEDPSDVHEVPFDTIRAEWKKGGITEL